MTQRIEDTELVARFQAGEIHHFDEITARYSSKVFSLALRLTRSEEDAEEVLQDVFITVYKKLEGFEGKSLFSSWLYRVTVNASLMKLRKKRQDPSLYLEDAPPESKDVPAVEGKYFIEGESMAIRNQVRNAMDRAIRRLPEEYRVVFVLRDVEGLPASEVGKMLDLSIPAVKSRLHRARLMLRKKLNLFYRDYCGGQSEPMVSNY